MDSPARSEMSAIPRVELLNTGTELLFGSVLNTHAGYLGRKLFLLGLRIQRQLTVPDGDAIREAIVESASRCEIILVTGGLGPTTDDITREIVAELTARPLRYDAAIFEEIRARFGRRGSVPTERVARQAYVPEGATVLANEYGTAPGLYLPAKDQFPHLFLFPGPPREFYPMYEKQAVPILQQLAGHHDLEARVFRTTGVGESAIEDKIGEELLAIPGLELGYCARMGEVDIRVIGTRFAVEAASEIVQRAFGEQLTATDEKELEEIVVAKLSIRSETVAVAESCTGGLLANRITNIPGSSAVFLEGNVTYSNEAKVRTLGVPAELIERHGAVSEPVARAMAEGSLERSGATYALSTTGIAGPDGGTIEKPVGTVFIGFAAKGQTTQVDKLLFPLDRLSFKQIVTQHALDLLRRRCG
jgi:nicotinamide-nucleotide amidase